MSLEITGKLIQKMQPVGGTSAKGNTWQKQEFVIETEDQYPRKICANLWGDKIDQLNQYNIGDLVKVSFDLESREFNGRWYTDVKAWKLERPQVGGTMPPQGGEFPYPAQPNFNPAPQHTVNPINTLPDLEPAGDTFTDNGVGDDLPF
ncbi:MAG: DUF3127 domain-containing protein [Bacteroidales bacterium]|nr:DUF3127 domain-containing protein [Bacteroidales bacterium]